ncbi:histidinol-phosphate transaminase [Robertmurraya massiliosenegalensis]|uniref:histidinol-phosphate transaminase n=1 Tax=Robertmurraya massiliosenegalensis TaxID=1287657 RepID=UPI0002D39DA6|nr:histidinol-phosphate transaminase [Robertmurraya massiliosenegalensis]
MSNGNGIKKRKVLDRIIPYTPGKPLWEVQQELGIDKVIKLASNENPLGPSPKAVEAIRNILFGLNRYPDAHGADLKSAIANNLSISSNQLIVTNGADELITLISETFLEEGDEIIVPFPSFSEYEFGAHLMGAKVIHVPLDENFQFSLDSILTAITENTKLIYICSPNNPTGTYLSKLRLVELLNSVPKTILVVFDSAYSHFATNQDYSAGLEFVRDGYPIIVLQTFSKIFGLAGVRVGFGVANESIIQDIIRVKEPFNVNSLALAAATAAITDNEHVYESIEVNSSGREQLYKALSEQGLRYVESMSNFILVDFGSNAREVYEQLLLNGVIVRHGEIWGIPNYLRISIGTREENEILIEAVCRILQKLEKASGEIVYE